MEILSSKGMQFPNGQPQVMGVRSYGGLRMQTEGADHMQRAGKLASPERVTEGFAGALNAALGKVENLDVRAQRLTAQAVYDPDSVNAHTVVLAAEKARFALNLTKTMSDGFIRAYRELTSGR